MPPRKRALQLRCPICKKDVKSTGREFPFCSPRCRTIDLGKWASGDYVVAKPLDDDGVADLLDDPEGKP